MNTKVNATTARPLRCAVYVRVSVADDRESKLTSIDAQAEACKAYIKSQQSLGWVMVEPAYTDDGVTGATLQRPGLRALLEDVRQDKIDVVVVHRLDRLSRSLFDLTDLIPLFTVQQVTLVSVTQSLDTQTPNGRLSLNLLTSFAQFEREIIGERTRDKVAATRAKGMWQGSGTPLGYTIDFEQRLVVVDPEVGLVQDIYRRYLSCDSTADLISHLQKHKVKNKTWLTRDGKKRGGLLLDRTAVYRILNNRMYIGEALFHGEWHSGVYPPIIDLDLWKQVQEKLALRARRKGVPNETLNPLEFPLIGKLFWHDGRAYKFFKSSSREQKRYLYYIAPATADEKASGTGPVNMAAQQVQDIVVEQLRSHLKEPQEWLARLVELATGHPTLQETDIVLALKRLDEAWPLFIPQTQAHTLFTLVDRVKVFPDKLAIKFNMPAILNKVLEIVQSGARARS
jgi:DNA invertase Pin-like site-specific DNA recombinase